MAESWPRRHVAPVGTPSGQTCLVGATSVESGVLTHAVNEKQARLDNSKRASFEF